METNLSKPWYGVWNVTRSDRVITNEAGATIAMVPVLFGEEDAEHTEQIITGAINRQDDLVDSLHRQAVRVAELTEQKDDMNERIKKHIKNELRQKNENAVLVAALDQCVEALSETLDALYNETEGINDTPWIAGIKIKARTALEAAKKARE